MRERGVEFELQGRVRKYLEYIIHKDTNTAKEDEILNKLTKTLRKEVILASNGKHLKNIPLFMENFSARTIEELTFFIKPVRLSPEEYIFQVF